MQDYPLYAPDDKLISLSRADGLARVSIYQPVGVQVVMGRGSAAELELHLDTIASDNVPIYRRKGGGCSVVLDPGNVVVAATLPVPGLGSTKWYFDRCTNWLIEGLRNLGVQGVQQNGISDLVIGDRKIAGSALYRMKGLLYFSCSLLVAPDISLIPRYLKHPPREPEYRRGRTHTDFVTSLRDCCDMELNSLLLDRMRDLLVPETLFDSNPPK